MGNLRVGHLVEAGLWLGFALFLYIFSFQFEKEIEIYKYGASAWPRAIILLMVIAAVGQLLWHWRRGDGGSEGMLGAASDDGAENAARDAGHSNVAWYALTAVQLAIPFLYMRVPHWMESAAALDKGGLHSAKLACAAIAIGVFAWLMRKNKVGAILALPILFAAMLQDLGFYAIAPFFILGVMYLMGEKRVKWMVPITVLLYGLILFLFLNLLYVGLPTGNVSPFYDFGTWVVKVLQ